MLLCDSPAATDTSTVQPSPSPSPYTMSQEMRKIGLDVAWQWNSPKRNMNKDELEHHHPMARKRRKSFTTSSKGCGTSQCSPAQCSVATGNKVTGFYKIRDELLKAKKEESSFLRLLQEDSPFREERPRQAPAEPVCQQDVTLTRKLSDEYLNDSDMDENLLIISQEMEKKVQEEENTTEEKKKDLKTATSILQSRAMNFSNDSFDQYLIDIPFDELLNRNARNLDQTIVNSPKSTATPQSSSSSSSARLRSGVTGSLKSSSSSSKGTLNRTLSLPSDPTERMLILGSVTDVSSSSSSNNSGKSSSSRAMARHESMPSRTTTTMTKGPSKLSASNPTLTDFPMTSSSTESLCSIMCKWKCVLCDSVRLILVPSSVTASTEKRVCCSQSEIALKRQIAKERLKLKQQSQNKRPCKK